MLNQLTNHCSLRTDGDSHINFWSYHWAMIYQFEHIGVILAKPVINMVS